MRGRAHRFGGPLGDDPPLVVPSSMEFLRWDRLQTKLERMDHSSRGYGSSVAYCNQGRPQTIFDEFGDLHSAANAAGFPQTIGAGQSPAILEETDSDKERIIDVSLNGVFHCTRAQISAMARLPRADRTIVNVASHRVHGTQP